MGTCIVAHFLGQILPPGRPPSGARVPAWPKAKPPPWAYKPGPGGLGQSMCVCAHLGPKGGPGHPWTSLYLPLQTGRFSRRERNSLVGRVSEIAVISKISAEIAVRADCCAQIFHRYFTDISAISLGFCPSINKISIQTTETSYILKNGFLPSDLATHNVRT